MPNMNAKSFLIVLGVCLAFVWNTPAEDLKDYYRKPPLDDKGWVKQKNGLEIWDVQVGTGEAIKPGATVTVHYTGWLTNGTVFDSSRKRDEPATFSLNRVIQGWEEGIPGMKPGGIRRLKIPPELGYGAKGAGALIPGDSTLIFEIEMPAKK
jgi:FKBP-type peptidyl-prolyl cis-trans isomerase